MTMKDDGGYAFPIPLAIGPSGDVMHAAQWASGGMTIRDYFAGAAMTGLLASNAMYSGKTNDRDALALDAYAHADAMISERNKEARNALSQG